MRTTMELIKRNCYTFEHVEKFKFSYLDQLEAYLAEHKKKALYKRMATAFSAILHKERTKATFSCDRYHDYVMRAD